MAKTTIEIDAREFHRKMGELYGWVQGKKGYETPEAALRTEMRLLIQKCVQATPPKLKSQGTNRIKKEVGTIVNIHSSGAYNRMQKALAKERARTKKQYKSLQAEGLLSYLGIKWTPDNLAWARSFTRSSGNAEGVVNAWMDRDAAKLPAHHQKNRRPSDGRVAQVVGQKQGVAVGVQKYVDILIVTRQAFMKYVKGVYEHVGKAKAGWNAAASKFGLKVPEWIRKHGTKDGAAVDALRNGNGYLESINKVEYIGRLDSKVGILKWALASRERILQTKINKQLELAAARFNR